VLRITETSRNEEAISFKLEGKVFAPWLDELRRICTQSTHGSRQICLDLGAVSFVDAEGAQLLRELIQQGITISKCSAFVAELLHLDKT
jgi:anti-anti-sigma regulatory factor